MFRIVFAVALLSAACARSARAGEPLPPPRPAPPPPIVVVQPLIITRVSAYEHWQYVGPDRQGRFRPRVVLVGDDAFYVYNGAPYPFVMNHPHWISPSTFP
jgi:hypothetical protein